MKNSFFTITLFLVLISITISQAQEITLPKEVRFNIGDNPEWTNPNFDDSHWGTQLLGKSFPILDVYAWYRIKIIIPENLKKAAMKRNGLLLNLGKIDDVDQTFFNGKLVGETGSFPPNVETKWQENRSYPIPLDLVKWGKENVISVRMYSNVGGAGMYEGPYNLLPIQWSNFISVEKVFVKTENKGFQCKLIFKNNGDLPLAASINYWVKNQKEELLFSEKKSIHVNAEKNSTAEFISSNYVPTKDKMFNVGYEIIENETFISIKDEQFLGEYEIYTPKPKPSPRINGPLVYGCRPGHPFLYRIPCQGERPIKFSVKDLPAGLNLDAVTGIITGNTPSKGEYNLVIKAVNSKGNNQRKLKIISGDKLALTPYMGWNHWYAHYSRITDKMMREAADLMISSGMADVGYQYVNIDDCWGNAPKFSDSLRVGPLRDEKGNINTNQYFPDMLGLTNYIHSQGLKAGIYTSPGPFTCTGFAGAYQHEEQDARQFAAWGFDFLKYDWCSYFGIQKEDNSLEAYQKPMRQMGNILKSLDRDIVFNLCQYGRADVWKWGGEVGGNSWRTGDDLGFELDKFIDIAIKNTKYRQYQKPGEWNDPDYIQIGWIGNAHKMGAPELTKMSPSMQYAYMSLWSLLASPLIYSGDMSKLDPFTLNVLCNPEVIEVNQDVLGECGLVIEKSENCFLMVKNLADGSKAVGLFNRGKHFAEVEVNWAELGIMGKHTVRDLWHQKDLGVYKQKYKVAVPAQGVVMVKISK